MIAACEQAMQWPEAITTIVFTALIFGLIAFIIWICARG